MIISNAEQQTVSNETSKVFSIQNTLSASAVRQQMHTTIQKTVSVSSKQSAESVNTDKVHTSNTDVANAGSMTSDRKDSQNQKTKGSNKSEYKKDEEMPVPIVEPEISLNVKSSHSQYDNKKTTNNLNQSSKKEEIVTSDVKESISPQRENKKKNHYSPTKSREKVSDQPIHTEKAAANTNGKTVKPNQKVKKNNKQEKQVETKMSDDGEKQDLKVEATEVKVISESKDVNTELKQGIKKVAATASSLVATEIITDSQFETPTPTKKKKKSKKSKGQGKDISIESKIEATETKTVTSEKSHHTQEKIAVAQIRKSINEEHIQVMREVIAIESKDHQSSLQQKGVQKHLKASEKKKGVTVIQQSKEESRDVSITVTSKSEQNQLVKSTTGTTDEESQRQEVQVLISHITEIQRVSGKNDAKSLKTLLNSVPDWLMSPERKCELEGSVTESDAHKNQEILSQVKHLAEAKLMHLDDNETMERHECEPISEKDLSGGATPRISKISIGSAKIENQISQKTCQDRRKVEVSQCKSVDLRAPSPLLRMRSPSPTFITIESTRRTDSPQRVTPSPTLLHRPPTPPTPPPRRCDTPTSRLTRITPSPTFDRAENLARLKDTTAKLSRGVTPPPILSPQQILEKKSEIVESPASFHRQIKIDSQVVEEAHRAHVGEEQAHFSECINANEIQRKSETHTPLCHNDPDLVEDSDISEPSTASVKEKREFFEEAQKAEINKSYVRKEPIAIPERLGQDMEESVAENENKEKDELPRADMSSLVNKFESAEEEIYLRKELIPLTEHIHDDTESTDCDEEKTEGGSRQKRSGFSEKKSITDHFSNVDEFGNGVIGTRTTVSEHSESVSTEQTPFSYADAVKRKAAAARRTETYDEDATEKLLRNFHKTWTESETVFKSLGYTVSAEMTSHVVSHQTNTVSSGKNCSLSNGCSDSGQKKIP
uniref:Uncharacterized protein n=1 Tax=Scophthalmus maximus TaxID=52904 RepID=A0A8D3CZA9_SCOMX